MHSLAASFFCLAVATAAPSTGWLPEGIPPAPKDGALVCPGQYLTPEQGAAVLDQARRRFPDRASWEAYARHAPVSYTHLTLPTNREV